MENLNMETAELPDLPPPDNYEIENFIGKGQFGYVYQGKPKNVENAAPVCCHVREEGKCPEKSPAKCPTICPAKCAIKVSTYLARFSSTTTEEPTNEEIRTAQEMAVVEKLIKIKHRNVIDTYNVFRIPVRVSNTESRMYTYFVMELCKENLEKYLQQNSNLPEKVIRPFFKQIGRGLIHLHKNNILHRDLKPANVLLVKKNGKIILKICDFGLSCCFEEDNKQELCAGTPAYRAPEIKKPREEGRKPYGTKVDIFSFGVMFFECYFGAIPKLISNAKADIQAVLRKTMATVPNERIKAEELFELEFFKVDETRYKKSDPANKTVTKRISTKERLKKVRAAKSVQNDETSA